MVQVAVACGWIIGMNILTILALKFLNREHLTFTSGCSCTTIAAAMFSVLLELEGTQF